MIQTISRLYEHYGSAADAIADLKRHGFPEDRISLVTRAEDEYDEDEEPGIVEGAEIGASVGGTLGAGAGLLAGLGLMAIPGVGPVVAAGWLLSTAAGAVAGALAGAATGGIVGSLTDGGVDETEAHVYAEALRRGGTLVTVQVPADRKAEGLQILEDHGPVDSNARRAEYRLEGWERFDENAPPYRPVRYAAAKPAPDRIDLGRS